MKALRIILMALAFISLQAHAKDGRNLAVNQANNTVSVKRIALVIGNSKYNEKPLANTTNDARDIATTLRELGFDVTDKIDATQKEMNRAIAQFGEKLNANTIALFYYAGHGMQVKGKNYLIPVDAEIAAETSVRAETVDVDTVLDQLNRSPLSIVILDACRNNPFERRFRSTGGGLAVMDAPKGTLIAYATSPGSVASDGTGRNGLYTQELLKAMRTPGLPVERMFKEVRKNVTGASGDTQTPWEMSSLTGEFYFKPSTQLNTAIPSEIAENKPVEAEPDSEEIKRALESKNESALIKLIRKYPDSDTTKVVREALTRLRLDSVTDWVSTGNNASGMAFYYQPSSIGYEGSRAWVKVRSIPHRNLLENIFQPTSPYTVSMDVFDCKKRLSEIASEDNFDSKGTRIGGSVKGDPRFVDTTFPYAEGSTFDLYKRIACAPSTASRLISYEDLYSKDWILIGLTANGDANIYLLPSSIESLDGETYSTIKNEFFSPQTSLDGISKYKTQITRTVVNCKSKEFALLVIDAIDDKGVPLVKSSWLRSEITLQKAASPSAGESLIKTSCALAGLGEVTPNETEVVSHLLLPLGEFRGVIRSNAARGKIVAKAVVSSTGEILYSATNGVTMSALLSSENGVINGIGATHVPMNPDGKPRATYPDGSLEAQAKFTGTYQDGIFKGSYTTKYDNGDFFLCNLETYKKVYACSDL